MNERIFKPFPGGLTFLALVVFGLMTLAGFGAVKEAPIVALPLALLLLAEFVSLFGFFTVAPNEAKVVTLFGRYIGSAKDPGLWWGNPFYRKQSVSQRVRNFESAHIKVNDNHGNPIEIAAVIVWHVNDSAKAVFEVDSFTDFVKVQTESALRDMASHYPYDAHQEGETSLRANAEQIAQHLQREIQDRVVKAGLTISNARITHLAYSPEIAMAMLQRQQASAIIAARQKIVEGAVGMVEMALDMLSKKGVVRLDEERKAAMVSNLLVVLCGERATQPVVNAGSIYQ